MRPDDERLAEELADRIPKLDETEAQTPDFAYFRDLVHKQQAAVRRAQRRQLALFVAVAAALVSAIILCMGRSEVFLYAFQGAAVAAAAAVLSVSFIRARRLKEGTR